MLADLARKISGYVENYERNVTEVVATVEQQIVDLNRKQMFFHKGGDDKPLIHSRTGSQNLSAAYQKRTGKVYPDIYVTGAFQKEMQLSIDSGFKTYTIASDHWLQDYLPDNYKNLYGIAKSMRGEAYSITTPAIAKDLKNKLR